jgi:hypothetical protein
MVYSICTVPMEKPANGGLSTHVCDASLFYPHITDLHTHSDIAAIYNCCLGTKPLNAYPRVINTSTLQLLSTHLTHLHHNLRIILEQQSVYTSTTNHPSISRSSKNARPKCRDGCSRRHHIRHRHIVRGGSGIRLPS